MPKYVVKYNAARDLWQVVDTDDGRIVVETPHVVVARREATRQNFVG